MTNIEVLQNLEFDEMNARLGAGAQGAAKIVTSRVLSKEPYVFKSLKVKSKDILLRTKGIAALSLPTQNPFLAGPIIYESRNTDEIVHIAPFAEGKPLNKDIARSFPERMEIAHHAACNWTTCEEIGYFHGDIRLPHLLISKEGAVSLIDHDNGGLVDGSIPPPPMAGDPMMMPPELRDLKTAPTRESDRFEYAVWFHMLLFERHPAEGLAQKPPELAQVMSAGRWSGYDQHRLLKGMPVAALGYELPKLFVRAFSINPTARPAADEWRRAFRQALKEIDIHICGNAYVQAHQSYCPWCNAAITADPKLQISLPNHGRAYRVPIEDQSSINLGREKLGPVSAKLSGRHLDVLFHADQIHLRHCGRNHTLIRYRGNWFKLDELWWPISKLDQESLDLLLGDVPVQLSLER